MKRKLVLIKNVTRMKSVVTRTPNQWISIQERTPTVHRYQTERSTKPSSQDSAEQLGFWFYWSFFNLFKHQILASGQTTPHKQPQIQHNRNKPNSHKHMTNSETPTETEHKMQGGLLLNVVISKGPSILKLLPSKNQPLLVWWDPLLILDLSLNIVNGI